MNVKSITDLIEEVAPLSLQEDYDNCGLLIGDKDLEVKGVLLTVDVTEAVIDEAVAGNKNLIIAHHPLIFNGLKSITGKNETERCVAKAIKNNIAIYAAHTNIDNVPEGVSGKMADKIGLINKQILEPKTGMLVKLTTYVPDLHSYRVRKALFDAGAGNIGNYDACSFNTQGNGTFRANQFAQPFVGVSGEFHTEKETKIEVIVPSFNIGRVVDALIAAHPYEEPAYDIYPLNNKLNRVGLGIIGELPEPEDGNAFLQRLKSVFQTGVIRYTNLFDKKISKVALCGGAGSSLLQQAIAKNADIFVSGDFKYHEFFETNGKITIADIGHFESEQFTKDIFYEIITKKMPTFAVQISDIKTNPINYL